MSDVQLFACAIATKLPLGVVTISISWYTFDKFFSKTIIAKIEVPTEIFPVRFAILFVATIPVPASPSGGQNGIPHSKFPLSSRSNAPFLVSVPAFSPETKTFGIISLSLYGFSTTLSNFSNISS